MKRKLSITRIADWRRFDYFAILPTIAWGNHEIFVYWLRGRLGFEWWIHHQYARGERPILDITRVTLDVLANTLTFTELANSVNKKYTDQSFAIGQTTNIKRPQRFVKPEKPE